jgi:hypothetical protein
VLAQHPKERRIALHPQFLALTIDGEGDHGRLPLAQGRYAGAFFLARLAGAKRAIKVEII